MPQQPRLSQSLSVSFSVWGFFFASLSKPEGSAARVSRPVEGDRAHLYARVRRPVCPERGCNTSLLRGRAREARTQAARRRRANLIDQAPVRIEPPARWRRATTVKARQSNP